MDHAHYDKTLIGHLSELRQRVIRCIVGLAIVAAGLLPFTKPLYDWIARPFMAQLSSQQSIIATQPSHVVLVPLQLVCYLSVFFCAPWLLYQAWAFVAPGLYLKEKRYAIPLLLAGIFLFYIGTIFAYWIVLPNVFHFLQVFKPEVVTLTPDIQAYFSFILTITLAFGLCFNLPVVMIILVLLGVVTPKQLSTHRRHAIVGNFVLAAVLTPPDVLSQITLALPLCLLYELGIWTSRIILAKPQTSSINTPPP